MTTTITHTPQRIQRRRAKGWKAPEGAVYVGRPTIWGNPFGYRDRIGGLVRFQPDTPQEFEFEGRISADGIRHDFYDPDGTITETYVRWATREEIVELYRRTLFEPDRGMLFASPTRKGRFADVTVEDIRRDLAGKDLMCWCKPSDPCHADLLLDLANPGREWAVQRLHETRGWQTLGADGKPRIFTERATAAAVRAKLPTTTRSRVVEVTRS